MERLKFLRFSRDEKTSRNSGDFRAIIYLTIQRAPQAKLQTVQSIGSRKVSEFSNKESDDILKPLLKNAVRSVLIKGEPGTGKTTLAFELLRLFGRGIYLSTRVSREQSKDHHPDLDYLFESGDVLEINAQDYDIKKSSASAYSFQDLRFSNPENVVNALIDGMRKIKEPLIILDSWDAIANRSERIERLKVEQSLALIALGNEAKLVFLSEEPQLTTTDYLVDAVVTLQNGLHEERRIRRVQWNKIRGSAMVHWSNLYTLAGGRFTVFSQHSHDWLNVRNPQPFKPLPHKKTTYSSGSTDIDDFLGNGLRKGSFSLFELGKYVDSEALSPFITSIRANFILNDGVSLALPSLGVSGSMIKEYASRHLPEKLLEDNLRLGYFDLFENDRCFFELDKTSTPSQCLESFLSEAIKIKGEENRPAIISLWVEILERAFRREDVSHFVQEMVKHTRKSGDILFIVTRYGSTLQDELSNMSDMHVRFDDIEGTLVVERLKPWSQLFSVIYDYSPGYPSIRLAPFV